MPEPFSPQVQRNYLDDILDQAYNDLDMERQRQENIINAPDPAQRLGEIQKVEKQVENEVPEVQQAVREKAYTDTSYYTGRPFAGSTQQTGKKRQPVSEAMYNRLAQGSAELGQGLASAPGFIAGLVYWPQRQLAKIPGLEALDDGTREVEEFLALNPIAKYYKDTADKFREQNTRYDESIVDYIKKGNLVDAIGLTAVEIVGSIPYTASMIAGGYAGVSAKLMVPAVATVTGGQKNSTLMEEMPELGDDTRTLNALVDGLAEGTFEQLGSAGIGRTIKSLSGDLIKQFGRKDGNKILAETIAKVFSDKSSRFMVPKAMNQEGWEEFATTVVQNLNAQLTGEDPGRDLFEGAIDSYIVGAGAGGAITAPVGVAVRKQRKEAKKLEKAKKKGLEAIESGTLDQLTNDEMTDFTTSLTKEEAMKLGVIPDYENQRINYEPESDLGKEMIRRNLEMEKYPETDKEFREAGARANIKEQQMEGKDFVGSLINKINEMTGGAVKVEREYLDRTLADEIEEDELSEERVKEILREHGLDENSDPKKIMITGRTSGFVVRLSTAGTEERLVDEYVAINEEMAEVSYNAESQNRDDFNVETQESESWEKEITEDRIKYHEATGEAGTRESNKEWFSTMAIRFATQGKVHESIGAKLKQIFNRFIAESKAILMDAIRLRKAIKAGKVSDSLLKKLEEATDFKKVGEKVKQAKESKKDTSYRAVKSKTAPDGSVSYRITEVGKVDPVGVFLIGADMVARDLDGKLDPFGIRYTENYSGFALSKAGASKLVKQGKQGFNTVAVIAYDQIKGSQEANPSFQNRVKDELAKEIGKRRLNKLLKDNKNDIKVVAGIVNKEIQEFNEGQPKDKKKDKINQTEIALNNAEPDAPQLRRKIIYVGTLKEIRTGKDRFRKHDVYPAEQIFDTLVELKEPIPIDDLIADLPDTDIRKKNWGMMVTQTNFLMTADESNIAEELIKMGQSGKDVFTGTPNPDFQFFSRETEDTTPEQAVEKSEGEDQYKARQFASQLDDQLGLGTATRSSVGFTEEYGDESSMVTRFFGKQDKDLLEYRGALVGLMYDQLDVTTFYGNEDGPHSLIKITIPKTELVTLRNVLTRRNIPNKTIRIRGDKQDILLWNFGDIDVNYVLGIAEYYNAEEQTTQKGEFRFITNESSRKKARQRYIEIIQNYQAKTETGLPKAVTKFLPVFHKRKAERERLLKQLKAKPKSSYHLAPTFYSKAERVVTEQFPPTMKSQSVENFLLKNQVKPEEIQWLDLETLTRNKPKITKEELQDWIQANKIDVQDVVLGELQDDSKIKDQLASELDWFRNKTITLKVEGYGDEIYNRFLVRHNQIAPGLPGTEIREVRKSAENDYQSELVGHFNDIGYSLYSGKINKKYEPRLQRLHELEKEIKEQENIKRKSGTRHSQYQLPGEKEDYRELLLTLPERPTGLYRVENEDGMIIETDLDYNEAKEFVSNNPGYELFLDSSDEGLKDTFTTGHYDEPNILAHVRFNTRKSPTGEQVLFIEELQSDWHTKGRKHGYRPKKEIKELPPEYTIETKESDGGGWWARVPEISTQWLGSGREKDVAIAQARGNALISLNKGDVGVPDAPFKNNGWVELIMKRMLRYASENNFDRIAWTTSNQQIDRWASEIRKNVDQIHWQKIEPSPDSVDSNKLLEDLGRGIPKHDSYTLKGSHVIINGLKKKENVFNNTIPLEGETTINGQKVTLEGLLGKQMATQIRNSDKPTGIIEGDNLTIGGQGFKTVYDFAIKKILNKMGKKFGAKVDQVELDTTISGVGGIGRDAEDFGMVGVEIQTTQPSIPVTRKMKESALKGQPTFRASKMTSTEDVLDSPSFKKWFKGSKVVDENGKPLVVYHGTVNDFERFSNITGSWFSENPEFASLFAGSVGNISPVYLSIKNPLDFRKVFTDARQLLTRKQFINGLKKLVGDKETFLELALDDAIQYSEKGSFEGLEGDFDNEIEDSLVAYDYTDLFAEENGVLRNWAEDLGYDGLIVPENRGNFTKQPKDEINKTYLTFNNTQIKSVFNKGTFNPHDPRISFHMAPKNLVTPLAKIYQEQKGTKKSYTKKNFENDLVRLGYPDDTVKTAMDLFGIIRIKQIETDDPTPIEKELKKIQDLHITRSNLKTRIKRAYTLGAVEKEKEIKKLQKIITKYARDNMPIGEYKKSEVTGLLAKVRDAKRAQQLAPALERIDRVIDKVQKRSVLDKWNKTVKKKAKVKKVSGIVRGTVGPDVQDIVNDIRGKKKGDGIMDLSPADVEHKIELMSEIMEASETGEPTDAQAQELNLLLTYGAMKHKTPEEITYATKKFDKLVTDGRMQVIEEQQAYKERMGEVIAEILDVITGGAGAQTQAGAQRLGLNKEGKIEEWKEFFSTLDSDQQSLEYIFDKLSRLDKTSGPLESAINKYFMPRIRQARLAEYNGLVEMQTLLKEKAEKIFKVKGRKLTARLNDNTIGELRVDHLNGIEGEPIFSILSHNQAIKKWMELMDPTLVNTFEKTGWDVEKAKRQIEEQLPKDMLEWGKWQLFEFYPMYYHRVNETFRKRFYVNMPFNSFYSPISRRIGAKADEGDDTLNKSKSPMGSMSTAGSLKGRVSNVEELAWIDGDTTIMKHITEMEHFIHYTELMRELRTVFMNRNISRSIDDFHGKGISRVLNKFLDDIARGGVDRANNLMWMDKLRANFSRAVIGANPVVYMKQLASIPAYMADIPILDWNKEFIKLFNPIEIRKMYRTLTKSEMLKMRYDKGFERDMVLALQNVKPGKMITGSNLFNNAMYAFTKMGDKQAIFVGGWPVYKYHLKQALKAGKSKEEAESIAMRKFEEASLRSQQASDVEDLGDFARRGSAYKLFTMFMTSPNQYYRMVAGGYRNLYYKRGSKSENWRRVFIGQFLLPTLFQFISNGFQWDDKDQAMSVLLFPFSGLLFWGQGFEYLIRSAFNKAYPMGPVAIMTFVQDWGKSLKRMFNGKDLTPEDTLKIIDSFIDGVSKVGGVPYGPATRTAKGIIKVAKGEAQHPIREAIGFKFKGKKKKKKKKKAKVAQPMFLQ